MWKMQCALFDTFIVITSIYSTNGSFEMFVWSYEALSLRFSRGSTKSFFILDIFPLDNHFPSRDVSWLSEIHAIIDQGARFGPLINLGLIVLIETLGTHFKIPLRKANVLALQDLIM